MPGRHVLGTKPDFIVRDRAGNEFLVFLDGSIHRHKESNDKTLRDFLRGCGYHVIEIGHRPYTKVHPRQIIYMANQVAAKVGAQWGSTPPGQSNGYSQHPMQLGPAQKSGYPSVEFHPGGQPASSGHSSGHLARWATRNRDPQSQGSQSSGDRPRNSGMFLVLPMGSFLT